jgi:hypothetical protein
MSRLASAKLSVLLLKTLFSFKNGLRFSSSIRRFTHIDGQGVFIAQKRLDNTPQQGFRTGTNGSPV